MKPRSALPLPEQPRLLASYGRRRGRPLRASRQLLTQDLLPRIEVKLPEEGMLDVTPLSEGRELWLEIGFGGGEHLARQAQQHMQATIIGCEPYLNGVASLLARIDEHALNNIRLFGGDARLLMQRLPEASLAKAFILYPDPWPKTRHHKRRLISVAFLGELARVMQPGAVLQLATDDEGYAQWMLEHALACAEFTWQARTAADWRTPPQGWESTRYESKALAVCRKPFYFAFTRR